MNIGRHVPDHPEGCRIDPSPKRKRGACKLVGHASGSDWRRIPVHTHPVRSQRGAGRAFSMAEVLVSLLIVSGLVVVALNTVGDATVGRQKAADRGLGQLLAQDLISEILRQYYQEPDDTPIFGREASESATSRAAYDDVDDYHGWDASPPQQRDGTEIPDAAGWRRCVAVEYADPDDLTATVVSDLGVKRITVTVKNNDIVVASLLAVRIGLDYDGGPGTETLDPKERAPSGYDHRV